ncbi:MAG: Uncharacterised protein [SAR116 cluster bacterium MED-G04]|nr:MAG: Uncharacterised protein [SAR116 cluster bacterium MED-G04]
MQEQHLDIADDQISLLNGRGQLRQAGQVPARKDILADKPVRAVWRVGPPDGVDQPQPVLIEATADAVKEIPVMLLADMFQHPDRNNPVKLAFFMAIILQLKADIGVGCLGAVAGLLQLLFGQRDAFDGLRHAGQMQCHAAPAGTDIQHGIFWPEPEFTGDMILFTPLRLINADPVLIKIGTGILPVLIQKKPIEIIAEIIMMTDVAA